MTRSDYVLAVLLGSAYVVLIGFCVSMTMTWGDPLSSNEFWGQSNVTAIAYMQIYHSIGVGLAALPIALTIVWRYKANWLYPATVAAVVGSLYMLFDQLRGAWFVSQNGLTPETYHMVSGAIDVVKTGLILFVLTAILRLVFVPKKRTAA